MEAGLRTHNIYSPYPEEFNRQAVGIVAKYNFAPTQLAADNLLKEGKNPDSKFITGNTVIDAMQHTIKEDYTHPELDWVGEDKLRLENEEEYKKMARACNPYGDGHACERIADVLEGKEYSPWVAE